MYTPPVTPWELGVPEVGELTQGAAAEGKTDDWGEVVTRLPYRKVRLDHLLSREKAEVETRKLIPRSMRERSGNAAHSSKEAVPKTARKLKERVKHRSGGLTDAQRQGNC